jgi:hypothetical protein
MTSPTIRRQRAYERQQPPAQPIFTSVRPYVDWQQNLIQGFEEWHAERVRHRHSRTGRHSTEATDFVVGQAGPSRYEALLARRQSGRNTERQRMEEEEFYMGQRLRVEEKEKAQRRVYEAWQQQQQMERERRAREAIEQNLQNQRNLAEHQRAYDLW